MFVFENNMIVLSEKHNDRYPYIRNNTLLRNYYLFLIIIIFVFLHYNGNIKSMVNAEIASTFSIYIIGIFSNLLFSFILAHILMILPSYKYAKHISPIIIVNDKFIYYLGGSKSINYYNSLDLYPAMIPLLGMENSYVLRRDLLVVDVCNEKNILTKIGTRSRKYIILKDNITTVRTAYWLDDNDKMKVINILKYI